VPSKGRHALCSFALRKLGGGEAHADELAERVADGQRAGSEEAGAVD